MSWDAIGALAETLGTLGIFFSLIYLSIQFRDERKRTESESNRQRLGMIIDNDLRVAESDAMTETLVKAGAMKDSIAALVSQCDLNPIECYRYIVYLRSQLITAQIGLLDQYASPEAVTTAHMRLESLANDPLFRIWWGINSSYHYPWFQDMMDEKFAHRESTETT